MLAQRGRGHCGVTEVGGNCLYGDKGSYDTVSAGIMSLEGCARKCLQCKRCNVCIGGARTLAGERQSGSLTGMWSRCVQYVSFNLAQRDCSWYNSCPRYMRSFGGRAYTSQQVKALTSMPPPPPPPRWAAPPAAGDGYCSLMGAGLGDCTLDDQGSWEGISSPGQCIARCSACQRCRFVSFTLANATEGAADRSGGSRRHPPYWWRCRWYQHCKLSDLRRSPPLSEPWQYVTVRVASSRRQRSAPKAAAVRAMGEGGG